MSSLNDLIVSAISGVSDEVDQEVEKVASAYEPTDYVESDIEKIASALEYVARHGVESFSKEAMAHGEDESMAGDFGENPAPMPNFGASENKSHHPALASNESAASFAPEVRNKMIDPTLKSLLANANKDSIHTKHIVPVGDKSKVASSTKEMLRQAIAAKMADK